MRSPMRWVNNRCALMAGELSFRGVAEHRTTMCNFTSENPRIPRCAIARLRSDPADHPGMTEAGLRRCTRNDGFNPVSFCLVRSPAIPLVIQGSTHKEKQQ